MPSKSVDKPLEIVVLAAGKGSRMHSQHPKVLHEIGGRPLLAHVVEMASTLKPQRIHVVVGHGKEEVQAKFDDDDRLSWVVQEQQLGTGHAVAQALPKIDEQADVLMLTADVPLLKSSTLEAMVEAMVSSPLTLLTAKVPDPSGLGRIIRDDSNAAVGIVEHKDASSEQRKIDEINSGIICARASDLASWLAQIGNQNAQGEYYLTDIVDLAAKEGSPIAAIQADDPQEVMGINDRVQLAQAERAYQRQRARTLMQQGVTIIDPDRVDIRGEVSIEPDTIIDINVVIEGPCQIGRQCYIGPNSIIKASRLANGVQVHPSSVLEDVSIDDDVNIGPFARLRPGTQLAKGVRIGNFVETKKAHIGEGSKVNHLSYVGDATVGENTNIGAGVITCNYDGANKHQTTIGNDVFVGSDAQLVAPVSVDDGATIGAGSTITNNVASNQLAISRGRQREIDNWKRPTKKK